MSSEREGVNSAAINRRPFELPAGGAWVDAPLPENVTHQTTCRIPLANAASIGLKRWAAASVDVLRTSPTQGLSIKRIHHRQRA